MQPDSEQFLVPNGKYNCTYLYELLYSQTSLFEDQPPAIN